jgi:mono/diheme cytochrome c family protein
MSRKLAFTLLFALATTGASAAVAEDLSGYTGAQLFQRFCASCHGKSGDGNGPVAPFFKLRPPDLTQLARRSGGQFPAEKVRQIIDGRQRSLPHGAREMPVWGLELELAGGQAADPRKQADANISLLVEYLRSIQVN